MSREVSQFECHIICTLLRAESINNMHINVAHEFVFVTSCEESPLLHNQTDTQDVRELISLGHLRR